MKYRCMVLILVLCMALFAGCTSKPAEQIPDPSVPSLDTATSAPVSSTEESSVPPSSVPVSSKPPVSSTGNGGLPQLNAGSLPIANFDGLLEQIGSHGTSVQAYGELKSNAAYAQALADLEAVLDSYSCDISVVSYSIDGKKALSYNTEKAMFCACTVKAAYTLYCCKQMEQGNGSLTTKMTYKKEHYEGGTGNMQYASYGTQFTMDTILRKSMGISDNVGYRMSIDYFGREGYNEWITDLGCPTLTIKPTVWSLKAKSPDLAKIWGQIYHYFKTDSQYARFLYEICTNTADNYGTAVLKNVDISHKQGHNNTADWPAYSDAGIVWNVDTPYVYVILTNAPGPSSYNSKTMASIIGIIDGQLF